MHCVCRCMHECMQNVAHPASITCESQAQIPTLGNSDVRQNGGNKSDQSKLSPPHGSGVSGGVARMHVHVHICSLAEGTTSTKQMLSARMAPEYYPGWWLWVFFSKQQDC